nr:trehalose-phosphatase [Shimwellia pseudoproteus]
MISEPYGFFFDFDGTLAELQPLPDQVALLTERRRLLARLQIISEGAVALISGRSLAELDTLTAPLCFALGGVHGAERRDINGQLSTVTLPPPLMVQLRAQLQALCLRFPGTFLEEKGMAFAVHYRGAEQAGPAVYQATAAIAQPHPELALQPGKCVVEIRPAGVSKGHALAQFLTEPPFKGRRPLFIGDDITDESAFEVVNQRGGISIKVGEGDTLAHYRLNSVTAVYLWLARVVTRLEKASTGVTVKGVGYEPFSGSL